jgi:hypothetical protein
MSWVCKELRVELALMEHRIGGRTTRFACGPLLPFADHCFSSFPVPVLVPRGQAARNEQKSILDTRFERPRGTSAPGRQLRSCPGTEPRASARHKQSTGLFVSGRTPPGRKRLGPSLLRQVAYPARSFACRGVLLRTSTTVQRIGLLGRADARSKGGGPVSFGPDDIRAAACPSGSIPRQRPQCRRSVPTTGRKPPSHAAAFHASRNAPSTVEPLT